MRTVLTSAGSAEVGRLELEQSECEGAQSWLVISLTLPPSPGSLPPPLSMPQSPPSSFSLRCVSSFTTTCWNAERLRNCNVYMDYIHKVKNLTIELGIPME